MNRKELGTKAEYDAIEDALTQYGGCRRRTTNLPWMPDDGIFLVESSFEEGDSDDDDASVEVSLLFAVDWERMKLLLADAELDLQPVEAGWTNVDEWLIGEDGALCLCRFKPSPVPKYPCKEEGVCFLAEAE